MPRGNATRRVEEVLRVDFVPDVPNKLPKTIVELFMEYDRKNLVRYRNNKRGWQNQYIARFDRWDYMYRMLERTANNSQFNPLVVMTDNPRRMRLAAHFHESERKRRKFTVAQYHNFLHGRDPSIPRRSRPNA